MTRTEVFQEIGGFSESFPLNYNDVDLCLKIGEQGYRIVYVPYAKLYHHESASKEGVFESELIAFRQRWGREWARDPFYNPAPVPAARRFPHRRQPGCTIAQRSQPMKVVIFCGGMGTRIRDHFELLPKPLIPVGSRPILWHIMKYYAHFGFNDFVLCLGYKREAFVDYFLHYRHHNTDMTIELGRTDSIQFHGADSGIENWRVTLADTGVRSSTGARLCRVAKYLTGDSVLLTYGDGVSTVDLDALLECHRSSGKLATVSAVHPAGRFGEIEVEDDQVLGFNEKPQTGSGFINGGFMVLEREFIDRYLSEDENCVLEADGLRALRPRRLARRLSARRLLAMHGYGPRASVARGDVGQWTCSVAHLGCASVALRVEEPRDALAIGPHRSPRFLGHRCEVGHANQALPHLRERRSGADSRPW